VKNHCISPLRLNFRPYGRKITFTKQNSLTATRQWTFLPWTFLIEHRLGLAKLGLGLTYKNSSGDEIANVNFYAVHPEATWIRWNNAK